MLQQFLNHIEQNSLFKKGRKVLLAVSGGLDSMVMLKLFKEAGYSVGVAHCNFQLRGEESDSDEKFMKEYTAVENIPFYNKRFETEAYALQHGLSIQMAARELRYTWFNELLKTEGYDYLATAHHLNDTIETVLLNFAKGTGMDGLTGIALRNLQIVRPLMFATREQLEVYAREQQLSWREDSSNQTDDYQRNFIRHKVVPLLKEINPSLEDSVRLGQRKISGEMAFLSNAFEKWMQEYVSITGEVVHIKKQGVDNASILWRAIKTYGFNFVQSEEILSALSAQVGKKFLSTSHQLVVDREALMVFPRQLEWADVIISADQHQAVLGSYKLIITSSGSEVLSDPTKAVLDAGKLQFPLCWRRWRPGDYFYPLGMEHKKKLSDFFIDKKLSQAEKHYATVLESAGEIVWVVGYRIDNRFKLTENTHQALSFTFLPYFD